MKIYEILMVTLAIVLFITGFSFGLDKELARRDYVKAVQYQDFEQPITGCIFNYNCEYYTNKLFDFE